ncbi:MAG: CHAT domain-containing protein [Cyanobacteria bacterium P01_G01_bin.49]
MLNHQITNFKQLLAVQPEPKSQEEIYIYTLLHVLNENSDCFDEEDRIFIQQLRETILNTVDAKGVAQAIFNWYEKYKGTRRSRIGEAFVSISNKFRKKIQKRAKFDNDNKANTNEIYLSFPQKQSIILNEINTITKKTVSSTNIDNLNLQSEQVETKDNIPDNNTEVELPSEPETYDSPPPTIPKIETETPLKSETYYTDISCPRRVWVNTKRISVTVRLTVKPSELSNAEGVNKLSVRPQLPVIVSIETSAFKILNKQQQEIYIESGAKESPPVEFQLQPIDDQVGHQRIHFYFHQANQQIGYNFVRVEITSYEVSSAAESHSMFLRSFPDQSLAPDFMLYIEYDQSKNARSLKFQLYENGELISFEPKDFKSNLESYVKTIYNKFEELIPGDRSRKFEAGNSNSLDKQQQIQINPLDKQRQIKNVGWRLWKDLIPQELKDRYIKNREEWKDKTLLIMSDDPYIPWELVWPYNEGKNYGNWKQDEYPWCISMKMTRWLNHNVREGDESTPPTQLQLNQLACIAPGDSFLRYAQLEREYLSRLCREKNIDDTTPDKFRRSEICNFLEEGEYNWFHIAAHGGFNSDTPDDASAVYLEEGEKLTIYDTISPDIEGHIWSARPAFFFNTCHGGRQSWGLAGLGGWPNHLISGGASLLIAPLWRVYDEPALDFARKFYEELLNSKTVAEAVQLSRKAAFNQYFKTKGDATWFTYSVYAHPNARISLERSK